MISEFYNFVYSSFFWMVYLLGVYTFLQLIAKNFDGRRVEPVPVRKTESVPVSVKIEVIDEAEEEDELNGLGRMMSALCLEGGKEEKAGRDFSRMQRCVSEGFKGGYKFASFEKTKRNLCRAADELWAVMGYPDYAVEASMPFDEDEYVHLQVEQELLEMREAMRANGVGGNKH